MKKCVLILMIALAVSCSFAKPNPNAASYKTYETKDENAPAVYFIRDITSENLAKIYDALGFEAKGKVGVKISTGESNNSNHLRPALIGDFVKNHGGIIVECNTAYGGNRASNAAHKQAFKDRGYD
ncbi:MAG: ferredoxin, partial [Treponema sp.]|nr:ferredoxin [Treponema sp.]